MGRMYRCYIVNYPFLIRFVWGTVSLMMDKEQNEKCRVLGVNELVGLVPQEALQMKCGGVMEEVTEFWPLKGEWRVAVEKKVEESMRGIWCKENKLVTEE